MTNDTLTDVPHCTHEDIGINITAKEAEAEQDAIDLLAAIDEYLKLFAKPVLRDSKSKFLGVMNCLKCGEHLDGFLGSFTWGIVHGEGHCSNCGWPCRAYHDIDKDGSIFDSPLQIMLQYHPSVVAERGEDKPARSGR